MSKRIDVQIEGYICINDLYRVQQPHWHVSLETGRPHPCKEQMIYMIESPPVANRFHLSDPILIETVRKRQRQPSETKIVLDARLGLLENIAQALEKLDKREPRLGWKDKK